MVPAPILNSIYKLNQELYYKGYCNFSNAEPELKKEVTEEVFLQFADD